MANIFLKKTLASMFNMSSDQVESFLSVAETFKNDEIDRNLAMELLNKLSRRSPQQINTFMKFINDSIA